MVELLVVVGIIAILVAILLPSLLKIRRYHNQIACQANLREVGVALTQYATDYRGYFPPNTTLPPANWFDSDRLGTALRLTPTGRGRVVTCPEDPDGTRSYAMNAWASALLDMSVTKPQPNSQWRPGVTANSSKLILAGERWSIAGPLAEGWGAPPTMGSSKATAGRRFGGGGGVIPRIATRWGPALTDVAWNRHRNPLGPGKGVDSIGRANFLYLDGHVSIKSSDDVVDPDGTSTLDSLWTPND